VMKTNTIPVRHDLSAKRGLPPFRLAFAAGTKGSMNSHSRSGNSPAAIGEIPSSLKGCADLVNGVQGKPRFC
jgi:hypothetical protein